MEPPLQVQLVIRLWIASAGTNVEFPAGATSEETLDRLQYALLSLDKYKHLLVSRIKESNSCRSQQDKRIKEVDKLIELKRQILISSVEDYNYR